MEGVEEGAALVCNNSVMAARNSGEIFARSSKWVPLVRDVAIPADAVPFVPALEEYMRGFNLEFGPDTRRLYQQNYYRLISLGRGADRGP